jgi:hypothetical protein
LEQAQAFEKTAWNPLFFGNLRPFSQKTKFWKTFEEKGRFQNMTF